MSSVDQGCLRSLNLNLKVTQVVGFTSLIASLIPFKPFELDL